MFIVNKVNEGLEVSNNVVPAYTIADKDISMLRQVIKDVMSNGMFAVLYYEISRIPYVTNRNFLYLT